MLQACSGQWRTETAVHYSAAKDEKPGDYRAKRDSRGTQVRDAWLVVVRVRSKTIK